MLVQHKSLLQSAEINGSAFIIVPDGVIGSPVGLGRLKRIDQAILVTIIKVMAKQPFTLEHREVRIMAIAFKDRGRLFFAGEEFEG